jgi:hypothetical protein
MLGKVCVGCVQQSGTHQTLGGGAFRFAAHTLRFAQLIEDCYSRKFHFMHLLSLCEQWF